MSSTYRTHQLVRGDVVATEVGAISTATGYVQRAIRRKGVIWRTVDDVAAQPRDRKTEPNRLVFFDDGTKAAAQDYHTWQIKEA